MNRGSAHRPCVGQHGVYSLSVLDENGDGPRAIGSDVVLPLPEWLRCATGRRQAPTQVARAHTAYPRFSTMCIGQQN
jgi:hypothetical protein